MAKKSKGGLKSGKAIKVPYPGMTGGKNPMMPAAKMAMSQKKRPKK